MKVIEVSELVKDYGKELYNFCRHLTQSKEGRINYSYQTSRGASGDGFIVEEGLFTEGQTGYSDNYQISEEVDQDHKINQTAILFNRDKNGTITVSVYEN